MLSCLLERLVLHTVDLSAHPASLCERGVHVVLRVRSSRDSCHRISTATAPHLHGRGARIQPSLKRESLFHRNHPLLQRWWVNTGPPVVAATGGLPTALQARSVSSLAQGIVALIGRDILASCQLTYNGPEAAFMLRQF